MKHYDYSSELPNIRRRLDRISMYRDDLRPSEIQEVIDISLQMLDIIDSMKRNHSLYVHQTLEQSREIAGGILACALNGRFNQDDADNVGDI